MNRYEKNINNIVSQKKKKEKIFGVDLRLV